MLTLSQQIFTPGNVAYAPGEDTKPIGWWKTDPDEEEGEFIPDLPPELDEPEEPPTSN